ncbi:50S ribosomal protein L23 [Candidatus Gottesmanbacteria bacterium]|nr:50S ribosomal protein L23 [Candidatus Gottesmanbacteria bacterium]
MSKNILIKPLITERSLKDAEKGVFTFRVEKKANKPEIKSEIESHFGVHVQAITTATIKGKSRFAGRRRTKVVKPDWKKAKVRLKSGEKIDLFEISPKEVVKK